MVVIHSADVSEELVCFDAFPSSDERFIWPRKDDIRILSPVAATIWDYAKSTTVRTVAQCTLLYTYILKNNLIVLLKIRPTPPSVFSVVLKPVFPQELVGLGRSPGSVGVLDGLNLLPFDAMEDGGEDLPG